LRRYICVRHDRQGTELGWCGTVHTYRDRADLHSRQLSRISPDETWDVHDARERGRIVAGTDAPAWPL
jgi:hypothetical protein